MQDHSFLINLSLLEVILQLFYNLLMSNLAKKLKAETLDSILLNCLPCDRTFSKNFHLVDFEGLAGSGGYSIHERIYEHVSLLALERKIHLIFSKTTMENVLF